MNQKDTLKRVLDLVTKSKVLLFTSICFTLLTVLANLFGPLLIGKAIDNMLGFNSVNFKMILRILMIVSLIYILHAISLWIVTVCTNKIAYHTTNLLRKRLFDKLNTLPLKFYDSTLHGDTMSRFINDADIVSDGLLQSISVLLTGIATIIGAAILMFRMHVFMALIVILSAPLSYYAARFVSIKSKISFKAQAALLGKLNGYAEEMISSQKVIKAFCYEDKSMQCFKTLNSELYEAGVKAQFYSSLPNPSTRVVNNIAYGVVGVVGSLLAIDGSLSIGNISSFLLYANLFSKPFNEITGVIPGLQSALASAARIFSLLDEKCETPAQDLSVISNPIGEIDFKNVSFSYDPHKTLINSLNLHVKAGSKVAIVGSTGAGKTTLINLLLRFYDVTSGDIMVDGMSIYKLSRENLRKNFGMVLQDTWLFKGTIKENITYGNPDAKDAQIIEAAKSCGAHSFIKRLPKGYDTTLSDLGDSLSAGQKQLLTIARVMLTKPSILILDEATSNIDTITELHIQKAFTKMMQGKTSFIIAHRLSTIKDADLILVMDKGNVVESGTHLQLLDAKGTYARLYDSQFASH
ncbi:MAG: sugar transporter ATP-binding protein [Clostridia bacterium]|jgi:ATP-binding cassette subfamily B protein|nr:sugar transporter ATP-binding protein [Clostridia bacterium]